MSGTLNIESDETTGSASKGTMSWQWPTWCYMVKASLMKKNHQIFSMSHLMIFHTIKFDLVREDNKGFTSHIFQISGMVETVIRYWRKAPPVTYHEMPLEWNSTTLSETSSQGGCTPVSTNQPPLLFFYLYKSSISRGGSCSRPSCKPSLMIFCAKNTCSATVGAQTHDLRAKASRVPPLTTPPIRYSCPYVIFVLLI